jgi:hypothetical protein
MFKIAKYIAGVWLAAGTSAALAGDLPPDLADSVMQSCRADYHRICADVVPGGGRAASCLLDHEIELAPPCLQALKTAHAINVCTPDYRRYCNGAARGPEAFECLASRMDALLPECRRIISANAPYMYRDSRRYAYGSPAPYGSPGPAPYPYRGAPGGDDRYAAEGEPNGPYGTYPYLQRPAPDSAYPYATRPAPGGAYPDAGRRGEPGERYAGEDERRFRSYDERYAGRFGPQRDYGRAAPSEREGPDEERE